MSPHEGQSDRGRTHGVPARIGSYEVQRVIGVGGMATVYAALQRQPRRTVAVKVMRHGSEADVALRRFRREIEILGKLRHPYIAQVFEAGVHQDEAGPVPFLVMEYVPRAMTIVEYANKHELSDRERIKLFVKVCAGVEHGHRKRVLHRDLKPGNILIDERGEPKVIDYGVAWAAEIDVTGHTLHTEAGRLIGTIQYMAPEQLDTSRPDLTPACDVYALGVVLFRLLTGSPPHDLKGMPVFVAAQVIKEDPPARPTKIKPDLKGDIETMMLKALAKDPRRRYPDAGSLGRDLLRYLTRKPIRARDAGFAYRMMLFLRRHRTEVIAATVVMLVIAAAAVVIFRMNDTSGETGATPAGVARTGGTPAVSPTGDASDADPASPAREAFELTGLTDTVTAMAFAPDDSFLAAADSTGMLALWHLGRRAHIKTVFGHDAPIIAIQFTEDAILTSADDLAVVQYDRMTAAYVTKHPHKVGGMDVAAMTRDGRRFVFGEPEGKYGLLYQDGEEVGALRSWGKSREFTALAFNPGGTRIAGGSILGHVAIWDTAGLKRLDGQRGVLRAPVIAISFVADSEAIAAIAKNGAGMIWTPGHSPERFVGISQPLDAAAFDESGRWVACAWGDRARVVDLDNAEGRVVSDVELEEGTAVMQVAISSDGRWCAVGEPSGRVLVYPVGDGE